jgi:hypothetical protein
LIGVALNCHLRVEYRFNLCGTTRTPSGILSIRILFAPVGKSSFFATTTVPFSFVVAREKDTSAEVLNA